jgi:hypothetical protein
MKTFSEIKTQLDEATANDVRGLLEHLDGDSFRGIGATNDFGRGGYDDPHHLSGRGQLLDVLIRKVGQLGVENDALAQEVAEKLGLDLGGQPGVQKLLKVLKLHALGLTRGDLPTEAEKREVLSVASQIAVNDMAEIEERPLEAEAMSITRAPRAARTPPNQSPATPGDPLGYSNQGNLRLDEPADLNLDIEDVVERIRAVREEYGLPDLQEDDLQEDKTDRELKKGLAGFIKDFRVANGRSGSRAVATELRQVIMQIVALKGLDSQRITAMMNEEVLPVVQLSLGEDITPILKQIVSDKQAMQVKFDNKQRKTIDLFTASTLIAVHDALNTKNQEKMRRMMSKNPAGFMQILNLASKSTRGSFR